MFQPLKATWIGILDLDTVNVGFTMATAISDAKRLQAPVGIVVKLVDEGKLSQPSRHHYSSRVCARMESDFERDQRRSWSIYRPVPVAAIGWRQ